MLIQAPKGTRDILPDEIWKWQYLERMFLDLAYNFGYEEIRIPVFEYTQIFQRGVGDTTDIVNKEMYTFDDKASRSLTLRPEGTAGIVRSYIENGMASLPSPVKLSYNISAYRYENVAKGRYREFHQFGIEAYGSKGPSIDGEVISLISTFFNKIGIKDSLLEINSIGCKKCRKDYLKALKEYFRPGLDKLCYDCKQRLEKNPMRILDCKEKSCKSFAKDAPSILKYLCSECQTHFDGLKNELENLQIPYKVNDRIVRGLDYYTKTVFEFVSDSVGAQGTICGGGRYDDLIEEFGGSHTPGVGFALGVERLLMQIEAEGIKIDNKRRVKLFIASLGEDGYKFSTKLTKELREKDMNVQKDLMDKSLKAQLKYANKINSQFVVVIGGNEIESGIVSLKNMDTGETKDIKIDDIYKEIK